MCNSIPATSPPWLSVGSVPTSTYLAESRVSWYDNLGVKMKRQGPVIGWVWRIEQHRLSNVATPDLPFAKDVRHTQVGGWITIILAKLDVRGEGEDGISARIAMHVISRWVHDLNGADVYLLAKNSQVWWVGCQIRHLLCPICSALSWGSCERIKERKKKKLAGRVGSSRDRGMSGTRQIPSCYFMYAFLIGHVAGSGRVSERMSLLTLQYLMRQTNE